MASKNAGHVVEQKLLLRLLDEGFGAHAWHGPNLRQAIRGVSAKEAAWQPGPGRHSIWELVLHTAYWTYVARRRLTGAAAGRFDRTGSNFFPVPRPASDGAWRTDCALLGAEHARLRALVASPDWPRPTSRGEKYRFDLVLGVASHHIYHAGQIRLLRRLQGKAR